MNAFREAAKSIVSVCHLGDMCCVQIKSPTAGAGFIAMAGDKKDAEMARTLIVEQIAKGMEHELGSAFVRYCS